MSTVQPNSLFRIDQLVVFLRLAITFLSICDGDILLYSAARCAITRLASHSLNECSYVDP